MAKGGDLWNQKNKKRKGGKNLTKNHLFGLLSLIYSTIHFMTQIIIIGIITPKFVKNEIMLIRFRSSI